jgi:hypothetical protein
MFRIQVDQSGRIEVLTVDTALGFSNDRQVAVLISAAVKRNCSKQLRARGIRAKMISIRMFSAGLYLLLEKHLNQIEDVTIDREFPGWEAEIKGLLLQQIYRRAPRFAGERITFGEIGTLRASRALRFAPTMSPGERIAKNALHRRG